MAGERADIAARAHYGRKRRPPGSVRTRSKTLSLPETALRRLAAFVETPSADGYGESYHLGNLLVAFLSEPGRRAAIDRHIAGKVWDDRRKCWVAIEGGE